MLPPHYKSILPPLKYTSELHIMSSLAMLDQVWLPRVVSSHSLTAHEPLIFLAAQHTSRAGCSVHLWRASGPHLNAITVDKHGRPSSLLQQPLFSRSANPRYPCHGILSPESSKNADFQNLGQHGRLSSHSLPRASSADESAARATDEPIAASIPSDSSNERSSWLHTARGTLTDWFASSKR